MKTKPLTVLSYGAGQDSTAILLKLIHDKKFRDEYAPGDLLVVMSDTGNEHAHTYRHVKFTKDLCAKHGIEFVMLTPDLGYHGNSHDLISYWRKTKSVGSKRFQKSCTDHLKIRPIYKFLDRLLGERLSPGKNFTRPKQATKNYLQEIGQVKVLIGIAKGEERRVMDPTKRKEVWMRTFKYEYPLIDCGLDRKGCQDLISSLGYDVPFPSNCVLCPFMNEIELLWLKRFNPSALNLWIEIENDKIQNNLHKGKENFGVWGTKLLPEKILDVTKKFGHMTDDELNEYKFSHGHCVNSKY